MAEQPETKTNRIIRAFSDHPVYAWVIVAAIALAGLGQAAGGIAAIKELFSSEPTEAAEPPSEAPQRPRQSPPATCTFVIVPPLAPTITIGDRIMASLTRDLAMTGAPAERPKSELSVYTVIVAKGMAAANYELHLTYDRTPVVGQYQDVKGQLPITQDQQIYLVQSASQISGVITMEPVPPAVASRFLDNANIRLPNCTQVPMNLSWITQGLALTAR